MVNDEIKEQHILIKGIFKHYKREQLSCHFAFHKYSFYLIEYWQSKFFDTTWAYWFSDKGSMVNNEFKEQQILIEEPLSTKNRECLSRNFASY